MTYVDTIRNFYVGKEASPGGSVSTWINLPFISGKPAYKGNRITPKENLGSRTKQSNVRRGGRNGEFDLKIMLYVDLIGYLLVPTLNAPTTTGSSGDKTHVFKQGSNVPTVAIRWSDGAEWWEMKNCAVNEMGFNFDAEKPCEVNVKFVGKYPAKIAAPTPVAIAYAAYQLPDAFQQTVTWEGGAYADMTSAKITLKLGRAPFHTISASADINRILEGDVEVDFDIQAQFLAYTGTPFEDYDLNTSSGALEIDIIDLTTTLGTTDNPTFKLNIPVPLITSGDLDPTKVNVMQAIKGSGGLDPTTSACCVITLINGVASY